MGQKLSTSLNESKVPDQFCKPQGLYAAEHVDLKRLKKLIQAGRLAPCWRGTTDDDIPTQTDSEVHNNPPSLVQVSLLRWWPCDQSEPNECLCVA